MHEGCKYIHSYFTNEARTVCIVVWESPSGELFEDAVQVDDDNALWKELLAVEGVNEDVIHENTFRKNKEDRKAYEEEVVAIAKKEGLWQDILNAEEGAFLSTCKLMMIADEDVDKELLFKIKIKIFEMDEVINSEDRELKSRIRKATNFYSLLSEFGNLKK